MADPAVMVVTVAFLHDCHDRISGHSHDHLADLLRRDQVRDIGIRPLWTPVPRVAGPAFTVSCPGTSAPWPAAEVSPGSSPMG